MNDEDRFDLEVMAEKWEYEHDELQTWLADPVAQQQYVEYLTYLESQHGDRTE